MGFIHICKAAGVWRSTRCGLSPGNPKSLTKPSCLSALARGAVALTLSFSSIWSIHVALVVAQERELAIVRQHWSRSRDELRRHLAQTDSASGAEDAARLYDPLVVFGTYERQVLEASTWPFNPKIVEEVAASLVAPILIYGIKVAIGLSSQA